MRKLMWFTVGYAVACGICALFLDTVWFPLLLISLIVFALGIFAGRKWQKMRLLTAVGLGCGAGILLFFLFDSLYLSHAKALNERELAVTIIASDYSYESDYRIGVDGILMIQDKPFHVRVYLDKEHKIAPGDSVTGNFRFRVTTPEGMDSYHPGKGIFLLAYQRGDISVQTAEKCPWWCFPAVLRQGIRNILERSFPQDVYPFVKALLLGESYDLSYETETALKLSGIRHIVAVSGLHVSILYGIISLVTAKRRFATSLFGLPALLLFAAVAGFTPSVCRASVMIAVLMISQLLDREYDQPTALSFAALLMLLTNPLVITSVGFQLSVGSVMGILLFQSPIYTLAKEHLSKKESGMKKLDSSLASSVSVTISAMSLTIPLSAGYFRTVSLVSFAMNFLTLWLVELVFIGILVTCVVALFSANLAMFLGWLIAWPVRGILFAAQAVSHFPFAAVYTGNVYIFSWLIFVYILIVVFLLTGKKHAGRLLCCSMLGLCLALGVSWAEPLLHNCHITMLDVGQGQCILLQSEGRTYVVDCGGDNAEDAADLAAETLYSQGISHLDGVIVTHYDKDHFGGIPYLLTRMETDLLILPGTADAGKRELLPEISGEILYVQEDIVISFGSSKMDIFGPVYSGYSNENSLCVLFDTKKCDILITGDRSGFGERMLLRRRELPDVDVLVAGHHGAEDSTTDSLLQAVRPEVVLISVSGENSYGHPHANVLARLEQYSCAVYRTDQCGTIIYRR